MADATPQPPGLSPDQLAAHALLSELRTRISVQRLPYQHGVEARALESLWELFGLTRKAMKDHPGCANFASAATRMLNVDLRPVTAKWHRAHQAGVLDSRDGADAFRADLESVRAKLTVFSLDLQQMAYGTRQADDETPAVLDAGQVDRCFQPIEFGIRAGGQIPDVAAINEAEAAEIAARRKKHDVKTKEGTDAVGLALSGGGIRSATFCMGVMQVLAARGLMGQVDFLSTVSGGGYAGSFVTSLVGAGKPFEDIGRPHGPDTEPFRHVRQHAKYLSAADLRERWLVLVKALAGMTLNWTAPLSLVAGAAWAASMAGAPLTPLFKAIAGATGALTAAALLAYGLCLRKAGWSRVALWPLAVFAGCLVLSGALLGVEFGYRPFISAINGSWSTATVAAVAAAMPAAIRYLPIFRSKGAKRIAAAAAVVAAGVALPVLAVASFYLLRDLADRAIDPTASMLAPIRYASGACVVGGIAVASLAFALLALDVNATSPHKLYRDALKKAFVDTDTIKNDADQPLSKVNSSGEAPYHLINATVNLPWSTNRVLRDRRGDFFVMSKGWTGSPSTGYHKTADWKVGGEAIGLATAMAVSGAAASPHMGLESRPAFAALLTLLNVRLGLWLPQPGREGTPGFLRLLQEMTGVNMSETCGWLNVTDGGHIENMGVYELLRRRCKFIVCVDGEADPQLTFHGQLTLVRHAQIDFGIQIEPRFDDVRSDAASGFSRTHAQMFRIHYAEKGADGQRLVGLMLCLKLSMTGNEPELLKGYRRRHPEFPHQPTADQFYDEEQFEAYRQLGVHVAEGTFAPALLTSDRNVRKIPDWFRQLASNLLEPSVPL